MSQCGAKACDRGNGFAQNTPNFGAACCFCPVFRLAKREGFGDPLALFCHHQNRMGQGTNQSNIFRRRAQEPNQTIAVPKANDTLHIFVLNEAERHGHSRFLAPVAGLC